MGQLAQKFPNTTGMSWWISVVAMFIALVVALITVSYHAVKAALTDPVKTLRYE